MQTASCALEAAFFSTLDALMIRGGTRILVAVSGGADSVALLRLFVAARETRQLEIHAAHLNHGIRGRQAEQDADFVQALCAHLDVPCILGFQNVPAMAVQLGTGLEDAARRARHAFLEEARRKANADCVALAHHMEDQAETVLLHLTRGCGLAGLTGMRPAAHVPPLQGRVIRPLLGVRRNALRAYLRGIGQTWQEDATNADLALSRNLVRLRALPALEELNPNLIEGLAGMADRLALDESCLREATASLALPSPRRMPYGACWRIEGLSGVHEALRRRALAGYWHEAVGAADISPLPQLESTHVAALAALLDAGAGKGCNLPGGWRALRGKAHLHLLSSGTKPPVAADVPLRLDGYTPLPGGARLHARPAKPGERGNGLHTQVLDARALQGAAARFRREGDRFHPLGAGGSQPLRQTFIDRGIDRPFRALIPLIATGSHVLWIVGLLPAQGAAVTHRTERAVHFTYEGALPWDEDRLPWKQYAE